MVEGVENLERAKLFSLILKKNLFSLHCHVGDYIWLHKCCVPDLH